MEPKDISLSRLKFKPTRWLWRGRIPYGSLTLLAGRSEVGKSSLLTEIAARVSASRIAKGMPGLTPEQDATMLKERAARRAGGN